MKKIVFFKLIIIKNYKNLTLAFQTLKNNLATMFHTIVLNDVTARTIYLNHRFTFSEILMLMRLYCWAAVFICFFRFSFAITL